jgi:hypothetical protein
MSRYTLSPDVVTRNVAGELVIVPVKAGAAELDSLFTLNQVATFVWQYLVENGGAEESAIVEALLENFETDKDTAERDLRQFSDELKTAGLIEIV